MTIDKEVTFVVVSDASIFMAEISKNRIDTIDESLSAITIHYQ